jgi:hypothetical protein
VPLEQTDPLKHISPLFKLRAALSPLFPIAINCNQVTPWAKSLVKSGEFE